MRLLLALLLLAPYLGAQGSLADQASAEALAYAEGQVVGQAGHYAFKVLQPPFIPLLRAGKPVLEVSHLSKQPPQGRFFAAVKVLVEGRPAGTLRVEMEGQWVGEVLKAKESLRRKQVLTEDLIERVPVEGQPPAGALTELAPGLRTRAAVQAGKFLTQADVEPIPLVNIGEKVRLIGQHEALSIHAEAIARSSGLLGDRVRLEMPSHKQITAIVTGPGQATLIFSK